MTLTNKRFAELKQDVPHDWAPETWVGKQYDGLAWKEGSKTVTVPTAEIYALERTSGNKPRPNGLEAAALTIYHRTEKLEPNVVHIPSDKRFPEPATVQQQGKNFLLVGNLTL